MHPDFRRALAVARAAKFETLESVKVNGLELADSPCQDFDL